MSEIADIRRKWLQGQRLSTQDLAEVFAEISRLEGQITATADGLAEILDTSKRLVKAMKPANDLTNKLR